MTERAVYWPRKCSQAAGQSAWLALPVSLTAHWPMKAGLYSPFQSTAHTIKEEPFIFPFHRPHTHNFSLFLSLSQTLSIRLSSFSCSLDYVLQFVSLPSHNKKRTNKTSGAQRQTESNSFWFSQKTVAECLQRISI